MKKHFYQEIIPLKFCSWKKSFIYNFNLNIYKIDQKIVIQLILYINMTNLCVWIRINDINLKNEIKRIENKSNILFKDWNNSELKNSIEVSQYLYDNKYPLLIRRLVSLYSKLGDEDWFSFDIESNKLKELYSIINIPFLFVFCLNDQYVNYTNNEYKELIQRIEKANSYIKLSFLKDNHFIENSKDEFFRIVSDFFS